MDRDFGWDDPSGIETRGWLGTDGILKHRGVGNQAGDESLPESIPEPRRIAGPPLFYYWEMKAYRMVGPIRIVGQSRENYLRPSGP